MKRWPAMRFAAVAAIAAVALGSGMAAHAAPPTPSRIAQSVRPTAPAHPRGVQPAGLTAWLDPAAEKVIPAELTQHGWRAGETLWLENLNTHLCLDDSDSNGKDLLRTFPCYQNSYNGGWQKWVVIRVSTPVGYGYQWGQLQNVATGRCLDWSFQFGLRAVPCSSYNFEPGAWQAWERWYRQIKLNGVTFYEDVLQSGVWQYGLYCLDDSSEYGVRGYPCNGLSQDNLYQGWTAP